MHINVRMHTHTHIHTHTNAYAHACTYTHMKKLKHTQTPTFPPCQNTGHSRSFRLRPTRPHTDPQWASPVCPVNVMCINDNHMHKE